MTDVNSAILIVAASETDANLYYATGFWAPDPFIFTRIGGRRILIMSDLELDRAKAESKADEVLSLSKLQAEVKQKTQSPPGTAEVLDCLFKERQVKEVKVPGNFPLGLADRLRAKGYTLTVGPEPFFPERTVKNPDEVAAIRETLRLTEEALESAIEVIQESEVKGDELWLRGKPLTSELVRKLLHLTLMGSDCLARETIVAGGRQACDPHGIGSGPLKAHWPIVLDVFPVSAKTRYYADITRTVVKGKAAPKVKKMYAAVQAGQEIAFSKLKAGVDGKAIHTAILDLFEKEGFRTGEMDGRMQGFFHGTGHGLGLEIHEPPRISSGGEILQAGQVVTVEPGLYYLDAGGIRLEDDVLITAAGCENLTTFPKLLELT
ncbi:MAG: aminopeptidase P family protein [Candidatus Omnitrophica bacterium]|nr:aminopeptidase P family protein [Candidatus Omnitrophota bacterium]